jgi:hypothetical protein
LSLRGPAPFVNASHQGEAVLFKISLNKTIRGTLRVSAMAVPGSDRLLEHAGLYRNTMKSNKFSSRSKTWQVLHPMEMLAE